MRWRSAEGREHNGNRRVVSRVLIPVLVLFLMAGSVMAYLSASSDAVRNTLQTDQPPEPAINVELDGSTKTNVTVNAGNPGYAVYVRAAVVVTWKNENGEVLAAAPVAGVDYTVNYGTDWLLDGDGFYYYKTPVANAGVTSALVKSFEPVADRAPDGYALNVEIIAQTIQALGTTDEGNVPAVTDAWDVTVNTNGEITAVKP